MERPELLLQANPCVPLEVTIAPQGHGCGSQMFSPSRRPTATRMASSGRRRPQSVSGSAYSQSPLCGALEVPDFVAAIIAALVTATAANTGYYY